MPGDSQQMHRHECGIRPKQSDPEMPPAQALIHHSAKHFGEPEICGGKDGKHARHRHDQVKMRDHEICVVQISIERGLGQDRASESPVMKSETKPAENSSGVA